MLEIIHPFAHVPVAIGVEVHARTLLAIQHPLADVEVPIAVVELPLPPLHVVTPLALVAAPIHALVGSLAFSHATYNAT
jgi:hypothetical protein